MTWKTRLQKAMATAPDDQHRAKAEEKERQRWIRELMTLLEDAGFLGNVVREEDAMKHLAARVAAGRRASTLRQHVRYGRRLQSYMETVFGLAWLRGHGDFIGYVALLLEEPCGRTVPSSLFKSLAFWKWQLKCHLKRGSAIRRPFITISSRSRRAKLGATSAGEGGQGAAGGCAGLGDWGHGHHPSALQARLLLV